MKQYIESDNRLVKKDKKTNKSDSKKSDKPSILKENGLSDNAQILME